MGASRPAVPAKLKRQLFEEAGFRCAIPTCRATEPLDMEHIDDWAEIKQHNFENMIVLCKNCHGRVTVGNIPKKAIKTYKRNLAIISGRYTLFEFRMMEAFHAAYTDYVCAPGMSLNVPYEGCDRSELDFFYTLSSGTDFLHAKGMLDDGLLELAKANHLSQGEHLVVPTEKGKRFLKDFFSGKDIS